MFSIGTLSLFFRRARDMQSRHVVENCISSMRLKMSISLGNTLVPGLLQTISTGIFSVWPKIQFKEDFRKH